MAKVMADGLLPLADEPGYATVRDSRESLTFMTLSYVFGLTVKPSGHVDDKHVAIIKEVLAGQEKAWNVLLLLDTLYFAMLLPLLIEGGPTPTDGMSENLASTLSDAYDVLFVSRCPVLHRDAH